MNLPEEQVQPSSTSTSYHSTRLTKEHDDTQDCLSLLLLLSGSLNANKKAEYYVQLKTTVVISKDMVVN